MSVDVETKSFHRVTLRVDHAGLMVLKLLAHHAPFLKIEAWRAENDPLLIILGEIKFDRHITTGTQATFTSEYDANGGVPISTPDHADSGVRPFPRDHMR